MNIDNEKLLVNLLEKRKIFWEPIIAASILLMAILAVMVPLYIHSDNSVRSQIEAIRSDLVRFHEENLQEKHDFHGRLCAIEERNRGKS